MCLPLGLSVIGLRCGQSVAAATWWNWAQPRLNYGHWACQGFVCKPGSPSHWLSDQFIKLVLIIWHNSKWSVCRIWRTRLQVVLPWRWPGRAIKMGLAGLVFFLLLIKDLAELHTALRGRGSCWSITEKLLLWTRRPTISMCATFCNPETLVYASEWAETCGISCERETRVSLLSHWCHRDDTAVHGSIEPPELHSSRFFLLLLSRNKPRVQIDLFSRLIVTAVTASSVWGGVYQVYFWIPQSWWAKVWRTHKEILLRLWSGGSQVWHGGSCFKSQKVVRPERPCGNLIKTWLDLLVRPQSSSSVCRNQAKTASGHQGGFLLSFSPEE